MKRLQLFKVIGVMVVILLSSCGNNDYRKIEQIETSLLYPPEYGEWRKVEMPPDTGTYSCYIYYVNDDTVEKSYARFLWCSSW